MDPLSSANELRTVYFAFNLNDKMYESDVKDKNPLKDKRVREALYRAIDIDAVQKRVTFDAGAKTLLRLNGYACWMVAWVGLNHAVAKATPDGYTPLFVAAQMGHAAVVAALAAKLNNGYALLVAPPDLERVDGPPQLAAWAACCWPMAAPPCSTTCSTPRAASG